MSKTKQISIETENKFITNAKAELNKTNEDREIEKVIDFVETARIDCETQITLLQTSELPKAHQVLKRKEKDLIKAESEFDVIRYKAAYDFENYIISRENAEEKIDLAKIDVDYANEDISNINAQIAKYKIILEDFR